MPEMNRKKMGKPIKKSSSKGIPPRESESRSMAEFIKKRKAYSSSKTKRK